MPWLIKNDDVIQLEPSSNNNNNKKSHKLTADPDNAIAAVITTPHSSSSSTINADVMIVDTNNNSTTNINTASSSSLFFIHVPRCGGTSLMHYYQLPKKIDTYYGYNYWKRLGMYAFFSRYKTLERYNFPVWTSGNGFAVAIVILGIYFMIDTKNNYIPYNLGVLLILFGITLFLLLTIVFTAPVIGRFTFIHHAYLIFVHYLLCQFMECTTYCTGTNKTGYIMHLTAQKLLYTYQYVTVPQWNISCSMAIIRNPYSRMISIYTYNRFGEWESFSHFMRDWYHNVCQYYRANRECDEWYTPCHAIPQFEYTHYKGTALVKSIIKQEELKYLKDACHQNETTPAAAEVVIDVETAADPNDEQKESRNQVSDTTTTTVPTTNPKCSSVHNLPDTVRDALINMPHSNQRKLSKGQWYEYYTQETLDMVYEIYYEDFNYFHYNPILVQRPDLQPPQLYHKLHQPRNTTTTTNPEDDVVRPVVSTTSGDDDVEMGHHHHDNDHTTTCTQLQ